MELSIIVPTMNRPDLLLRLVKYYATLNFRGKILIGDSSREDVFQQASQGIERLRNGLQITHVHLPGRSVAAAVMEMNRLIDTPYVCLVADDDFIIPSGAARCIAFLESHSEYSAAHGVGVLIGSTSGQSDEISGASPYPQTVREESSATDRIQAHLASYLVSLFSVHRTGIWRTMFSNTPVPAISVSISDKTFADELLPCCLSVVLGKVGQVDGLYLVRQVHGQRYLLPDWFAWINNERWYGSYHYFRGQMANALCAQQLLSNEAAGEVVDSAFHVYLGKMVASSSAVPCRIREVARNYRLLRLLWTGLQIIREHLSAGKVISLRSLRRPSSPYFADFAPVFHSVTRNGGVPG